VIGPDISRKAPPVAAAAEIGPHQYFELTTQLFGKAVRAAGGSIDHFFSIGGQSVKLRFAGPALVLHIAPALEHLATSPTASPALTVCFFESASTGVGMGPPPWPPTAYGARGAIEGFNTDRIYTFYEPGIHILRMFDIERKLALYWVDEARRIPYWEASFPMRSILHWWTRNQPLQLMHSGAVGLPEGGVLLAGKSGSGKSTTTLACLDSDLSYVGDDYVLVRTDTSPYVYSMYNTAKLEPGNVSRLPHLRSLVTNLNQLETEKALIYLKDHYPDKLISGFPIKAILLPRVTGRRDTTLTNASPMAGLRALAPTTLYHLPRASHEAFLKMADLVKHVPVYNLELGTDLSQIPATVLDLLGRGGRDG
jgi:hypothetical protein